LEIWQRRTPNIRMEGWSSSTFTSLFKNSESVRRDLYICQRLSGLTPSH
jgi:hypothetical protein